MKLNKIKRIKKLLKILEKYVNQLETHENYENLEISEENKNIIGKVHWHDAGSSQGMIYVPGKKESIVFYYKSDHDLKKGEELQGYVSDNQFVPSSDQYNTLAVEVNHRLDVAIFDEKIPDKLQVLKYSKEEIKKMHIDDLITDKQKMLPRLRTIVDEIKQDFERKNKNERAREKA